MGNAWRVLWKDQEGVRRKKQFEGDRPVEAVAFGKELKRRGFDVAVTSVRRAFPPTGKRAAEASIGTLWCPYCIAYRQFHEVAIKHEEYTTPILLRCTICTISIRDAWVRHYNQDFYAKYEVSQDLKQRAQDAKKKRDDFSTLRGSRKVRTGSRLS